MSELDNNLIDYYGIDDTSCYNFINKFTYTLEGTYRIDNKVSSLLSFSANKECLEFKIIDTFEGENKNNEHIYGNIIVLMNKFELSFEYGAKDNISSLSMDTTTLHDACFFSLEDINFSDINITLLIKNMSTILISECEIFYSINLLIGFN